MPHDHGHPHHDHAHDHDHGHAHDHPALIGEIDHVFGQDRKREGEGRTTVVVVVTALMMVAEIAGGVIFGSMALLADGLHMASHTAVLGVTLAAYVFARKWASDRRFSFGTGKINSLAGFTSAIMLGGFSLVMAIESIERLMNPVAIAYDQALIVAVVGLAVNAVSAVLLMNRPGHDHGHDHGHSHGHHHHDSHHHDHNLRAAYLHVIADAVTSLLAIVALLAGRFVGISWLDPVMGIVGAGLVAHWSIGLVRVTGAALLDRQVPQPLLDAVRASIEADPHDKVLDLHVWSIGPGIHAAEMIIVSSDPAPAAEYRARIPHSAEIVHLVVEVRPA